MCHHIEPIDLDELGEALSRWNLGGRALTRRRAAPPDAYPGNQVAVAVPTYDKGLQAAVLTWGFSRPQPPSGEKSRTEKPLAERRAEERAPGSKPLFNTRLETAVEQARTGRGLWAEAIVNGRCLVPVRAFYEWDGREAETGTETRAGAGAGAEAGAPTPGGHDRHGSRNRRECRFTVPGGGVFLLAGLARDGRFSIMTTAPNRWVAPIHGRMPLVLGPGESHVWLAGEFEALADRGDVALEACSAEPETRRDPEPSMDHGAKVF